MRYPAATADARLVVGVATVRRDSAQGDRRRRAAAGRRGRGAGVGELAVVGRLPRGLGVRVRARVAASAPEPFGVGRRRAAGDLLLRRRARTQARVRRRRSARPRAAPRCRSRPPSAEWSFPPRSTSAINLAAGHPENLDGWAVPIATDIAFALAVLAVLSTHLPTALRTFLLTLAVVDDLLAITVIAVFYTDHLSLGAAGAGADPDRPVRAGRAARCAPVVAAGAAGRGRLGAGARQRGARHRRRRAAGLHGPRARATRSARPPSASNTGCGRSRPGFAVPVFAFFAAGVTVGGWSGLGDVAAAPGHRRRDRRPGHRQTPRRVRAPPFCWPGSPTPASTTTWRGATCSACRCWPGSGSQFRY